MSRQDVVARSMDKDGFCIERDALSSSQLADLLGPIFHQPGDNRPSPHALRNVLWTGGALGKALTRVGVDSIASAALEKQAFAINALYFDKTDRANWKVPRHQDLMMPVDAQVDEFVLAGLVALRIHFDDCPAANGSLSVLPGSHHRGKLRDSELRMLDRGSFVDCEAMTGDVLVMRPLLVHRSSAALDPQHRRVLHVVYATEEPGALIRWKRSASPAPVGTRC